MRPTFSWMAFLQGLIFWAIVALGVAVLAMAWGEAYVPVDVETHMLFEDLHVSLGGAAAILILAQIVLSIVSRLSAPADAAKRSSGFLSAALRQLIYLSVILLLASGLLHTVFAGKQIYFFKIPVPLWDVPDAALAETFKAAHQILAYALAAFVIGSVLVAIVNAVTGRNEEGAARKTMAVALPKTGVAGIGQRLGQTLRLFGWIAFWTQFLLALVSAPLLLFGLAGRQVSPDHQGLGDSIQWAFGALILLIFAILLNFYNTRVARRVAANPTPYLDGKNRLALSILGVGALNGVLGVLLSFGGVGLSVALLIGKTVSQPPGIAITDPNKIIRALDVFTLLVNFNLLFAHFVGVGVSGWLSMSALKARHDFVKEAGKPTEAEENPSQAA